MVEFEEITGDQSLLLGPKLEYNPQNEADDVSTVCIEPMNNTKALAQLGFVTARGLDNGELGALLLSNKTTSQIHEMEEKRRNYLKLEESKRKKPSFKSPEQEERERQEGRWNSGKVREELCLIHEAYQFFRVKYKKRYGDSIPNPSTFLKDNKKM